MPKAFLHKPPIKTPKHKPARCLLNCDEDMSSAGGLEESKFIISRSIIYALLYVWALFPRVAGPASVRFHARPCVLCIMMLLLCSVYSELRLYLDNCSHEDILSPHSGTLTCLVIGFDVPEGRRTSRMWWIPADCPASTVNSRSPPGPRAQSRRILFPWQTCSAHQTERPCSCTQTPNNRMLVLGQKRSGPHFWGRGWCERVVKYFRGFCNRTILCDSPLNGGVRLQTHPSTTEIFVWNICWVVCFCFVSPQLAQF